MLACTLSTNRRSGALVPSVHYTRAVDERFDLVVVGSGPAGEKGAAQAAYFGKRVALIERAHEPGGAAVHTGTLPSKTLRETALYLSGHRARDLYGISVRLDDPHAAVPRLIARKNAIAGAEVARIRANLDRHAVTVLRGEARLESPHVIRVGGAEQTSRVHADYVLLAPGSSPHRPADIPFDARDVYDSDDILGLDRIPSKLIVLGAGVIGCEYACMFAALGAEVTLVEARNEILPFLDEEIRGRLEVALRRLGITLLCGRKWTRVVSEPSKGIVCELGGAGEPLVAEKLLFAAGRVGNTAPLDLERVGIATDARGYISVDAQFRTSVPNVYAAGDVIGFPALASVSMEQARVAVCHAFGLTYKKEVASVLPYGIYTIPEVSCVGETEQSCRAKDIDIVVGRALYRDNARGQITGDVDGVTKLIVDVASRRVLGCHVIGERASELVHIGQAVMHLGGTVDAFIEMVFNYPTLSESYKYAAYDALGALARRKTAG